jgi:hypothetical protein
MIWDPPAGQPLLLLQLQQTGVLFMRILHQMAAPGAAAPQVATDITVGYPSVTGIVISIHFNNKISRYTQK